MIKIFLAAVAAAVAVVANPVVGAQGADLTRRADTPNFYFVTTSSDSNYHLKPLRFDGNRYAATLNGDGAPIQFYFEGGASVS
jgi:hypothetical protein